MALVLSYNLSVHSYTVTPQLTFGKVTTPERMPVTLTCTVMAEPEADFTEIVRFVAGERIQLVNDTNEEGMRSFTVTYSFEPLFVDDNGAVFQCLSINDNGVATANSILTVQGGLYIELLL